MTRSLAFLMLLTACGGGVCAGCGGDDADSIPDAFHAQTAPAIMGCDGPATVQANIGVTDANGAPVLNPTLYTRDITCAAAEDRGDAWVIRCETEHTATEARWSEMVIAKTLDGGSYTIGGQMCGAGMNDEMRTAAIVAVTVD